MSHNGTHMCAGRCGGARCNVWSSTRATACRPHKEHNSKVDCTLHWVHRLQSHRTLAGYLLLQTLRQQHLRHRLMMKHSKTHHQRTHQGHHLLLQTLLRHPCRHPVLWCRRHQPVLHHHQPVHHRLEVPTPQQLQDSQQAPWWRALQLPPHLCMRTTR